MAQSNFEERIDTYEIESTNVMTGDRDRSRYLYYQLKMSMAKAKQIDIIVSFLMESGVRMLLNDMKRALDRGVKIRILTGNYLGITQPSALYLIKSELGDRVDLRLYNETSRSFHPKSYIFHYESSNEIYIGSSNISKSALTSGIEWNYRFSDTLDKKNYELFYATFEDLFLNHSIIIDDEELKRYSKAWKKPAVSRDLTKYDAAEDSGDENVRMLYRPRGAQIEALYGKKTLMLLKICCVGYIRSLLCIPVLQRRNFLFYSNITNKNLFSLKFKSYFSNIDIVLLNENLKELKRKKRNEKARLRRREQK